MFARITPYKMKAGSREATTAIMDGLKSRIMELEGMTHFINVIDGDGKGYVVALTTNPEMSEETAAKVKALWGAFSEYLEMEPAAESYDVIADWNN
ncbi:hypothetical protein [Tropicimonas marinistellae]|uniref:hypothetical protein n=1 Tax=Tropicimonas marinistellae TaxID=1739787 RepID=UPI00083557AD|nr:hypothetical protein [Tropicimonas marinistellae]